ncbi:hypothetical protein QZH41_004800 [Actinostola sp. cb2023]|nr:hypothetical protein QZH41_004800 [Actinostola sp. cb2023]
METSVAMGTESDELIASILGDEDERSLTDLDFPFMEMDDPFAFISDSKDNEDDKEEGDSDGESAASVASTMKSEVKRTSKSKQALEQDSLDTVREKSLSMVSEADEHEMLCRLNACAEVIQDDCAARRLRRKLILRKFKRENGLPIFDLDKTITAALSSTKTYVFKDDDFVPLKNGDVKEDVLTEEKKSKALNQAAPQMLRRKERHSSTFLNRLVGADRQTLLRPITSPYTARVLKPFIRRDFESRPLKLRLLNQILAYTNRSFVIAFAFMVPDVKYNEAYISFILVHPEWRRAGIATYMLYHLIQTCMGKDVTLHVSANNQAMLMYQKFGFKPEEFILDFYEKYLPESSRECRQAYFLRLRR